MFKANYVRGFQPRWSPSAEMRDEVIEKALKQKRKALLNLGYTEEEVFLDEFEEQPSARELGLEWASRVSAS